MPRDTPRSGVFALVIVGAVLTGCIGHPPAAPTYAFSAGILTIDAKEPRGAAVRGYDLPVSDYGRSREVIVWGANSLGLELPGEPISFNVPAAVASVIVALDGDVPRALDIETSEWWQLEHRWPGKPVRSLGGASRG